PPAPWSCGASPHVRARRRRRPDDLADDGGGKRVAGRAAGHDELRSVGSETRRPGPAGLIAPSRSAPLTSSPSATSPPAAVSAFSVPVSSARKPISGG